MAGLAGSTRSSSTRSPLMLRCPVDGYPLVPHTGVAASVAVCEKCVGVWLTREALQRPSVDPAALPPASRVPSREPRRSRKHPSCPVCRRGLVAERVEGIEIDRCLHCGGVWVDPGEYDAVRQRIESPHPTSPAEAGRLIQTRLRWVTGVSVREPALAITSSFRTVFQFRPVPRPILFSIIAPVSFDRPCPFG